MKFGLVVALFCCVGVAVASAEQYKHKLDNGIEVTVEHPAEAAVKATEGASNNIVVSALKGAAELATTLSHETGEFVRGVVKGAVNLTKNSARAGTDTLKRAANRLRGRPNSNNQPTNTDTNQVSVETTPGPDELHAKAENPSNEAEEESNKLVEPKE